MLYHCDAAARYKVAGQAARPQKQEQDRPPHTVLLEVGNFPNFGNFQGLIGTEF